MQPDPLSRQLLELRSVQRRSVKPAGEHIGSEVPRFLKQADHSEMRHEWYR